MSVLDEQRYPAAEAAAKNIRIGARVAYVGSCRGSGLSHLSEIRQARVVRQVDAARFDLMEVGRRNIRQGGGCSGLMRVYANNIVIPQPPVPSDASSSIADAGSLQATLGLWG